jgi:TetR/AcrR family transcriptional repressor of nem operon
VQAAYRLVGMLLAPKKLQHGAARLRDLGGTRQHLSQAASREVYRYGFQSAGIDTILAATNVTKGALYYHFESKEALGHAIIAEIVAKITKDRWLRPLRQSTDKNAIDALIGIVQAIPARPRDVKSGCPLVNLTQEMSQLNEQFRKRLERIFKAWQEGIATALREGQYTGTVRRELVPEETASFFDRDGRRQRSAGKERSGREAVEYGDQKYHEMVEFSSRTVSRRKLFATRACVRSMPCSPTTSPLPARPAD